MHWPQICLLIFITIDLTSLLWEDGKKFKYSLKYCLLGGVIYYIFLVFGGFFTSIHLPQVIVIVGSVYVIVSNAIKDGEEYTHDFLKTLGFTILEIIILWWGGFFSFS